MHNERPPRQSRLERKLTSEQLAELQNRFSQFDTWLGWDHLATVTSADVEDYVRDHIFPVLHLAFSQGVCIDESTRLLNRLWNVCSDMPGLESFKSDLMECIGSEAPAMVRAMGTAMVDTKQNCMSLFGRTLKSDVPNTRRRVATQMHQAAAAWIKEPEDSPIFSSYGVYLAKLPIGQRKIGTEIIGRFLEQGDSTYQATGMEMARVYFRSFSYLPDHPVRTLIDKHDPVAELFQTRLAGYGLKLPSMIEALKISGGLSELTISAAGAKGSVPDNIGLRLADNVSAVTKLEQERPGICQYLQQQYGIQNFFRYPKELLISQYDTRIQPRPFGIMITAQADHNKAFGDYDAHRTLQELQQQIEGADGEQLSYGLVAFEVASVRDLIGVLARARRLAKQFAPSQKVSFAIIRGHGTADSIQFGGHPISQLEIPGAILSEQQLSRPGIANVVDLFEPRAPLLLTSCKTGLSIGQKLDQLGFTVKAPQRDTGVESYIVNRTSGQLQLDAVWGK